MAGGRGLGIFRMGADARRTKPWLKGWNVQPHLMTPREGRGTRGWIQPPVARDLISYVSIKTPTGVWELLDWRIHWCAGEGVGLEKAWKLCASLTPPPPTTCSMPLFHLAVLELHSLSKQNKIKQNTCSCKQSAFLSSANHSSELSDLMGEARLWEQPNCRQLGRNGDHLGTPLVLVSEMGSVSWEWALDFWDPMLPPGTLKLNWIDTQLVSQNWSIGAGKWHIFGIRRKPHIWTKKWCPERKITVSYAFT